jgi:glutaredoxin 3
VSEVTIFTKPGCPYCAAAKEEFQQKLIEYTEHNVRADQAALQQMLELNGGRRHVPTIVRDGQVQVGFNGY